MIVWLMSPCPPVRSSPEMCPPQLHLQGAALASPGKDASPRWLADFSCQGRVVARSTGTGSSPERGGEERKRQASAPGKERWAGWSREDRPRSQPAEVSSPGPFWNPRFRQCSCRAHFKCLAGGFSRKWQLVLTWAFPGTNTALWLSLAQ